MKNCLTSGLLALPVVCVFALTAQAEVMRSGRATSESYTFLMTGVTGGKIDLNEKEIQTLQNAFSIVLTNNSGAGNYGGVDFTLNVLDPDIFNKGLAKFTPNGVVGMYVEPDDFFLPGARLDFGGGARVDSPVTSTLLFANDGYTWESFAEFLETDSFKIVGHLQSLNQPSIQGATLIWEGNINRGGGGDSATTPEPASLLIFGSGLAGLGLVFRRRWVQDAKR